MISLVYTFASSKCFTKNKPYKVKESDEKNYFIAIDNQGDEVYVLKSNFNL
jgi:hypothetical protein